MPCGKIAPSCPPPCDRKLICLPGFISLWGCISLLTFCLTSYCVIGDLSPPSGNHNSVTVKIEVSSSFLLVLEYFLRTNCQFPLFMENTKKNFNRVTLFPFVLFFPIHWLELEKWNQRTCQPGGNSHTESIKKFALVGVLEAEPQWPAKKWQKWRHRASLNLTSPGTSMRPDAQAVPINIYLVIGGMVYDVR